MGRITWEARRLEIEFAAVLLVAVTVGLVVSFNLSMAISAAATRALGHRSGGRLIVGLFVYGTASVGIFIVFLFLLQNLLPRWFERRQLKRILRGESMHDAPAFIYHRIPNSRRSMKYATFFLGSWLINDALTFGGRSPSGFTVLLWLLGPLGTITVFLVMRSRIQPVAPLLPGEPSTLRALSWHRWVMRIGPGPGLATLFWTFLRAMPFVGEIRPRTKRTYRR